MHSRSHVRQNSARIGLWFALGIPLLLAALFFQTVTVAGGNYAGVLAAALVLIVLADLCLIQAYRSGGRVIRLLSVLLLLPTVFVVGDLIRRVMPFLG